MTQSEIQSGVTGAVVQEQTFSELSALLQREFKNEDPDKLGKEIKSYIESLRKDAGLEAIPANHLKTIDKLIADIDEVIAKQVNVILHHEEFQTLESAWRGLHYMVNNTETDSLLKIQVFNVGKKELRDSLADTRGQNWDKNVLFKKIYEQQYGTLGGEPFGCLVGDYTFDYKAPDVNLLSDISKIAAAAHAPFLAAAAPNMFKIDDWESLNKLKDITGIFEGAEYAAWRAFRDSDEARYVGLTMPRFLARLPYGADTKPVDGFAFEEDTGTADTTKYAWANAAYAMAANITAAFKFYGWCTQIRGVESGGLVPDLPVHTFTTSDGSIDMKCPTELSLTYRQENELTNNGFISLVHEKNTNQAAFISAQSTRKIQKFDDNDAQANERLSANLAYIFMSSRIAQYLNVMVNRKVGSLKSRQQIETELNTWLTRYKHPMPNAAKEDEKAKQPLSDCKVIVADIDGKPGWYRTTFFLKPHYQLEGMEISLRLVSKMPDEKK